MGMKYYYVFASEPGTDDTLQTPDAMPVYLGGTTDLSIKVEPGIPIALADGTEQVVSAELSCSFSLLGRLQRELQVRRLWLVPNVGRVELPTVPTEEVLLLDLGSSRSQQTITFREAKTGGFELIHFRAVCRYPVDEQPISEFPNFWRNYRVHIFPNVPAGYECIQVAYNTSDIRGSVMVDSAPVRTELAFFIRARDTLYYRFDSVWAGAISILLRGVVIHNIPPKE